LLIETIFLFSFNTRVITSTQGGMGKSTFVEEKARVLRNVVLMSPRNRHTKDKKDDILMTIRVQGVRVDIVEVVDRLNSMNSKKHQPTIYHFDVAPTVC